jgi:DNA polymerase-3 subunit gamma/tau
VSYVVLARKYRPMRFADMVGQEHVGRTLANAIKQGRVHHAYLFAGARGLGKTTTARIFAKALVCERGPTPEPCNVCSQCVMVTEGRSVDVVEIDGASNNSVENIRSLREQVHYLPQSARRKVYIIDEVHMLTTSAFNALLKTLEEPPAHVNFVFATTEPHKVLPTIHSRVSRLDFRRVSSTEIVAHLQSILAKEGLSVDAGGLRAIARSSGGSVRDAMTLLDQVVAFAADPQAVGEQEVRTVLGQADRPAIVELVDALLARDPDRVLARFDAIAAAGHDLSVLSMQLLEELRDLTVARVCKQHEAFVDATPEELAELRARANVLDPTVLAQTFDRLTRIVERLPTARSQRLVLEMGLLELARAEPLVPLGDLIARLQGIGDGGSGGSGSSGESERGSGRAPARGSGPRSERRALEPEAAPPAVATEPAAPVVATVVDHADDTPFMKSLRELGRGVVAPSATASEPVKAIDARPAASTGPTTRSAAQRPSAPPTPTTPPAQPPTVQRSPVCDTAPADELQDGVVDPFSRWTRFVASVREIDEYAAAVLRAVGLVAFAESTLRVAAPQGSFAHRELSSSDVRARVEQAAREVCGHTVALELVEGEPSLEAHPSIELVDRRKAAGLRAAVEAEARSHPGIAALVREFDGVIAQTRPLREP